MRRLLAVGMAAAATIGLVATSSGAQTPGGWVGTWAASPASGVPNTENGYPNFSIRNVVHTSVGGGTVRVRLSNAFGTKPLQLGQVTVAVAVEPNSPRAVPGTVRTLKFGGSQTITVPPGAEVLTDAAVLRVPEDSDLLVTTYVPTPSGPVTYHPAALQTSFFNRTGNFTTDESGTPYNERTNVWHYVSGVDVQGSTATASVVTLGDSITDGVGSTAGANRRWPDVLADRLKASKRRLGVLNAGISGNRLLLDGTDFGRNALARLDEDVLSLGGVRTLIVLEGINDIQQTPHQTDPEQIINAYKQIIAQAKARGIRVIGGTITPFKGWRVWNETLEATRQAVNTFIRPGGAFDGVIDFDAAIRDTQDPLRMKPEFDTGDHLHPNDAGLRAMGEAVPLALL
ncbi:SGNH/GDSL hydrolase family protein [Kibdelosporangium aridum]|uniref:SGNH/GDSL hydrolase family protein n=1 Tax=Kibdelosporangium aridum TaxID=2030 RepID=UPI0035E61B4A